MPFRTKLDYSDNRQIKQHVETRTELSGATAFGVSFSALTTGVDLSSVGIIQTFSTVLSTFSGNSGTTNYTWFDSRMSLGEPFLSALTPSISAISQTVTAFTASSLTIIDGNTVVLSYTGVSFGLDTIAMIDLGGGNYSGSIDTNIFTVISASSLDFTGRTIWVDVSGITKTQDLIITDNPVINYIWTCLDGEGRGFWASGGTAFSGAGNGSFAFGYQSVASGNTAVGMGYQVLANGDYSSATGYQTSASGQASNAGNSNTLASNFYSHAEGYFTTASGLASHAEGNHTTASNDAAHSEGDHTTASGVDSHAEGLSTRALGDYSHSEGAQTTAQGTYSHSEGSVTKALGDNSHSEGINTTASGYTSYAGGIKTKAYNTGEWVRSSSGITINDQYGSLSYAAHTTNATITEIFVGNTASERMFIPINSTRYCRLYATAIDSVGNAKQFLGDGLIKNITGTTALVGVLTMTSTYGDAALTTASITVTTDNVNDSLKVQVTGVAATTINWFIKLDYEQVQM